MTAPDPSRTLRDGIRRALQNEWFVVVVIFLTTVAVRWVFHLQNPRADGFLIYQGTPVSDGWSYTFKAISIAEGHGIPPVQQPAVRPFYPIILACLYTWCGFSLWAVAVLNIVTGGFTAALIYLCGARSLNRFCGLGAALFFAIDPSQLTQTPQPGTEPLGLLFFVASVYATLRAFETRRASLFFLSGLFIGLSNLTRTLTIFTLPFYLGLILLLVGIRERRFKAASIYIALMVLGVAIAILPWLIRQERMYRIFTISDNIGEAFYAATSPKYKQWTPSVRQDADADGIPNTIRDRYQYFMRQAAQNVMRDPGFYVGNVGASLWEYANTFSPRNRALSKYAEWYSSASKSQRQLLVFLVLLIVSAWLLRNEMPFSRSSLVFLIVSIGLVLVYRSLPTWLAFLPIIVGLVFSWRAGRSLPGAVLFGSMAMAVVGSAIFANTALFRTILMTDWLFLLYFLAALSFPAEAFSKRVASGAETVWAVRAGEPEENTHFQSALSCFSLRAVWLVLIVLLGFFAVSAGRLITLTIRNPPKSRELQLARPERDTVLRRLQQPPFDVLPKGRGDFQIYDDWKKGSSPKAGQYVALVQRFDYDYYIPAGKVPPRGRPPVKKPYARTVFILPLFDFTIPGEIPSGFSGKPLIFVGVVSATAEQFLRPQVDGLAIIPLGDNNRPDFTNAVCAPPRL
jgi:4-amino-4-deoxy-L-arabinose transferase-like glycosyltransferase